jgi:hypothetical protein
MNDNFFRVPKSRRAALAGGAALVLTAAAAHAVAAQQTAAETDTPDVLVNMPETLAAPAPADAQDTVFVTSGPGAEPSKLRDDWLKAVAGKLGVSTDKLQQAITDANKEVGPFPPMLIGGKPGAFSVAVKSPFAGAATALNISEADLKKEMGGGKSLTDIAKAHNVDPKVVADALKAQRKAELDKAASDGVMPKAVADKLKANIDDEIDHLMKAVPSVSADGRGVSIHLEWSPTAP